MLGNRLLLLLMVVATSIKAELKSLTVMVVLDGLRHDYLDPIPENQESYDKDDDNNNNAGNGFPLPNLRKMGDSGAILGELTPVFPSSRMPNLASLATGVYAETHGILDGKEVYDKDEDEVMRSDQAAFWAPMRDVGTIWDLHANADGGKRFTKIFGGEKFSRFLMSGDADDKEDEQVPDTTTKASNNETAVERKLREVRERKKAALNKDDDVDDNDKEEEHQGEKIVVDLLDEFGKALKEANKTERAFITIFNEEPGHTAQGMGPDAVESALKSVDEQLGKLVSLVEKNEMSKVTNFIVVSTPGYADARLDHMVNLNSFAKRGFNVTGSSPVLNIKPIDNKGDSMLNLFTELQAGHASKYNVYSSESVEERWHYRHPHRVGSIVAVAEKGVVFASDFPDFVRAAAQEFNRSMEELSNVYGWNGYDNQIGEMHSALVVSGPDFALNLGRVDFNTTVNGTMVDLFPLLYKVLHLESASDPATSAANVLKDRNGSLSSLKVLLRPPPATTGEKIKKKVNEIVDYATSPTVLPVTASVGTAAVIILVVILCVLLARSRHKRFMTQQGFRYSQVRRNRRMGDGMDDEFDEDDERGLLSRNQDSSSVAAAQALTSDEQQA